jgi:hypothetical protein
MKSKWWIDHFALCRPRPAQFQTISPDFHGSKDQVILLFLSTNIPSTQRGHIIFSTDPYTNFLKHITAQDRNRQLLPACLSIHWLGKAGSRVR